LSAVPLNICVVMANALISTGDAMETKIVTINQMKLIVVRTFFYTYLLLNNTNFTVLTVKVYNREIKYFRYFTVDKNSRNVFIIKISHKTIIAQ
jgi:hypothetical protein